MAQLYFKYGAMGSSKTANALMTRFNYEERGQKTLLVKPRMDTRDGDHMVVSRIGLTYPCMYFDEMRQLSIMELQQNACIIVDEATMATTREGVYAAGDAVSGAATVILAMGGGKEAAASIDKYIQNKAK